MFGLAPMLVDDEVEPSIPAGCRVRVKAGRFGGVGVVRVPALPRVAYSRVAVEFDDERGTWWEFDRDAVTAL